MKRVLLRASRLFALVIVAWLFFAITTISPGNAGQYVPPNIQRILDKIEARNKLTSAERKAVEKWANESNKAAGKKKNKKSTDVTLAPLVKDKYSDKCKNGSDESVHYIDNKWLKVKAWKGVIRIKDEYREEQKSDNSMDRSSTVKKLLVEIPLCSECAHTVGSPVQTHPNLFWNSRTYYGGVEKITISFDYLETYHLDPQGEDSGIEGRDTGTGRRVISKDDAKFRLDLDYYPELTINTANNTYSLKMSVNNATLDVDYDTSCELINPKADEVNKRCGRTWKDRVDTWSHLFFDFKDLPLPSATVANIIGRMAIPGHFGGPSGSNKHSDAVVEWEFYPADEDKTTQVKISGCGDQRTGKGGTFQAESRPSGGTYKWSADSQTIAFTTHGSSARFSCKEPSHALVRVIYNAPDGTTAEDEVSVTCFDLRSVGSGGTVEVPLHDGNGKSLPPVSVPFGLAPPDAVDVLDFHVTDRGIASAVAQTGLLLVQSVKEGSTTIQPKTKCGEFGAKSLPIRVVACSKEEIERLSKERQQEIKDIKSIAAKVTAMLASKEFIGAGDNIEGDTWKAAYKLADLMMLIASKSSETAKPVQQAADLSRWTLKLGNGVAAAINGDWTTVEDLMGSAALKLEGGLGGKLGDFASLYSAADTLSTTSDALNKVAQDLGDLVGVANELERYEKLMAEVEQAKKETDRKLYEVCKARQISAEPPQKGNEKASPKGSQRTSESPPSSPDIEQPPQDEPPIIEQPPEEPPAYRAGVPIDCPCASWNTDQWAGGGASVLRQFTKDASGARRCVGAAQASVKALKPALDAAGAALNGVREALALPKDKGTEKLRNVQGQLRTALVGLESFSKEAASLSDSLGQCARPLGRAGSSLKTDASIRE